MARRLHNAPEAEWLPLVRARAIAAMMAMIRDDLDALSVSHEVFFSEASLTGGPDRVAEAIAALRDRGLIYEGRLPPPKGAPPRIGRTASKPCSARPSSATTSIAR